MAESPFKGLLYSPEVLGGIGLLTAGLSGRAPDAALPMMMQGMKTASMYRAMEEEEEKRKFIKQFGESVPKEDQKLFKAFPKIYLTEKYKKTQPNVKSIFKNGKEKTFNLSKDSELTEYLNLLNNEGWSTVVPKDKKADFVNFKDLNSNDVRTFNLSDANDLAELEIFQNEEGRNVIKVPGMDKSTDILPKSNKTKLMTTVIKGTDLLENLNRQEILYEKEFLSAKGKLYFEFLKKKDQTASITGIELTNEERGFLNRRSTWLQTNQQYFNDYRKSVTGVAAGEKEIGWIQESIPSDKDTPSTYSAKLKNQKIIQQKLIDNAQQFLKLNGKPAMNEDGEYTEEYLEYIKGKIKPSGEMLENLMIGYKIDGYSNEAIKSLLNNEFKGINWEEIFETYANAKSGTGL
tara:strand:- start:2458 stop:3672 length:1215 start_codon:yes stop_codon:yes gene_type:complete